MTKEEYGRDENAAPAKDTTPSRVGDIVFSPLGTPREGTLVCDGSAVSRQTYKELFNFLGVSCGEGDGETTFNLPDLRDVWILCAGTEHEAGESVAEGLPNVMGSQSGDYHWSGASGASTAGGAFYYNNSTKRSIQIQNVTTNTPADLYFDLSKGNPIYGASTHVTPASVAVLPCIVYE